MILNFCTIDSELMNVWFWTTEHRILTFWKHVNLIYTQIMIQILWICGSSNKNDSEFLFFLADFVLKPISVEISSVKLLFS